MPLGYLRDLCDYWRWQYDWRATERRLNRWAQFTAEIDGFVVHFLHLRSSDPAAVPVILTHGWPGSFFEFESVIEALAATPGGAPVHLVVPSLPGYGFSSKPVASGWGVERIAHAWVELMGQLGYHRFVASGSDWGTSISTCMGLQSPDRLLGLHLVPPLVAPVGAAAERTDAEQAALARLRERTRTGSAYSAVHATRPQTVGYSLLDSPVGLCAWLVEKIWSWADHSGDITEVLSPDQILDNVSLYWFTEPARDTVDVPTACTVFPEEVPRPSLRWVQSRFSSVVHWGEPPRGGHFGAWE